MFAYIIINNKSETMNNLIKADNEYQQWLANLKKRIKQSQIKAAVKVNTELLELYWSIGSDIVKKQTESDWGDGIIEQLSLDLRLAFPEIKGFSSRNLWYMKKWFLFYSGENIKLHQVGAESSSKMPQFVAEIPWRHHTEIITKCKSIEEALFYIKKTLQEGWSRAILIHYIGVDLYRSQGKTISNFSSTLPSLQSELAQEMLKDPYNFDFIALNRDYNEKELKDALTEKVMNLLIEMGKGFAFVGREYPLPIEGTEEYIDLLFYHLNLHCYVVVEVKIKEFKSRDIGQIGTYINIVDDIVKMDSDGKTIGLIICKEKNNVLAKYAVNSSNKPIAISAYELSNFLPENLATLLPSTDELESRLLLDEAVNENDNNNQ